MQELTEKVGETINAPFLSKEMPSEKPNEEDIFISPEESSTPQSEHLLVITSATAIFDTGSSLNYLPTNDYKKFISFLTADQECEQTGFTSATTMLLCTCDKDNYDNIFPIVEFNIGGHLINLRPEFYLMW